MRSVLFFVVACALPSLASAQIRPQPGPGDAHIQSVEYKSDQVVLIEAAPGYQVTIGLAPDEQIESIAVGDSAAWQVTANRSGNHLFVKPIQAGGGTNMTVVTDVRTYAFDLNALAGPSPEMAYTVQFRYPTPPTTSVATFDQAKPDGRYKLSGARTLRPMGIVDDGQHTYIQWQPDAALPAVYAIDGQRHEALVNGNMRDGLFVIDSVSRRLVFRIDKQVARADRITPKSDR